MPLRVVRLPLRVLRFPALVCVVIAPVVSLSPVAWPRSSTGLCNQPTLLSYLSHA